MSRLCLDVVVLGGTQLRALPSRGIVSIGGAGSDFDIVEQTVGEFAHLDTETLSLEVVAPGVRVDGQGVQVGERLTLEPGARLEFGGTSANLIDWRPRRTRAVTGYSYFEQRGAEECHRALRTRRGFGVLFLRATSGDVGELEAALGSVVRVPDVVASYGPGTWVMLLFDLDAAQFEAVVGRLERLLAHLAIDAQLGRARFPGDGGTIERLVEVATHAALGRHEDRPRHDALAPLEYQQRVAQSDLSILILGETGSGKELLAARLHAWSRRAGRPFVKLNCAAFTDALLESELFGHERGAFTGAVSAKQGLLETADGGTVFLDEVGEMPLLMQAKMLRVLEERVLMRVGGLRPVPIDVRFIAATNRDLETEVMRGAFRADLFFRLDGASIIVPPLRERGAEFDRIVRAVLDELSERAGIGRVDLTPEALDLLRGYHWPGNVRELRNNLDRALWLAGGGVIDRVHLPVEKLEGRFAEVSPERYRPAATGTLTAAEPEGRPGFTSSDSRPPFTSSDSRPPFVSGDSRPPFSSSDSRPRGLLLATDEERQRLAASERATIERTLAECAGNQSEAARRLGISRRSLIKRMDQWGLARPRKQSGSGTRRLPEM